MATYTYHIHIDRHYCYLDNSQSSSVKICDECEMSSSAVVLILWLFKHWEYHTPSIRLLETSARTSHSASIASLLTFCIMCVCCHSNQTRAPIANPTNNAQLGCTPYHSPNSHPGPRSSVGMWQVTDWEAHIMTTHFAWLCTMRNVNRTVHYKATKKTSCTNRMSDNVLVAVIIVWNSWRCLWTGQWLVATAWRPSSRNWCGRRRTCRSPCDGCRLVRTGAVVAVPRHLAVVPVGIHRQSAAAQHKTSLLLRLGRGAAYCDQSVCVLSLIHIWRCRRIERCRSRWSPYH